MELLDFRPAILGCAAGLLKDPCRLALQPILPGIDVVRVELAVLAQFRKGAVSSRGREGSLGGEPRGELHPSAPAVFGA